MYTDRCVNTYIINRQDTYIKNIYEFNIQTSLLSPQNKARLHNT